MYLKSKKFENDLIIDKLNFFNKNHKKIDFDPKIE